MSITKGIPKYEMDNLTQGEFWIFENDRDCAGLPGQKVPVYTYVERLYLNLERQSDIRQAASAQLSFHEILIDRSVKLEQTAETRRKKAKWERLWQ